MKSPMQELINIFESREMSVTEFYMHFLKERNNYLQKEKDYFNPIEKTNKFKVYPNEHSVEYNGNKIILPKKEFLLFKYLMDNKNKILDKKKILAEVWEEDVVVGDRTVDVHICKIKQKFNNAPIVSRKRVGYIWEEKP